MNRSLKRLGALGASGVVVAAGLVLGAGAASAAPVLGTLSVSPASGFTPTNFTVTTSTGCAPTDNRVYGVINAPGWSNVTIISRTSNGVSTGPMTEGISDNLFNLASANGLPLNAGQYNLTLYCAVGLGQPTGEFDGHIFVTGTPSQGANQPYQTVNPNPSSTTTTLAANPAGHSTTGGNVTLTATVSPNTVGGTVQFQDAGANLGSPVNVSGGTASFSTTTLAVGSHSFTANYSGDQDNAASTTTSPTSYTVSPPAAGTTTGLSAPASLYANTPATFTVTTTPSNTSGPVTLTEGGNTIGSGTVANGTGTISNVVFTTQGSHTVVANFTPTGNFAPSSSAPVTVTVGAAPSNTGSETIETTVSAGSLTVSVDGGNPKVILPNPTLDQSANTLVTSGPINNVTVTDTRAGAPGFTLSGIVTDFTDPSSDVINGYNLGWTPNVVDKTTGMTVTPGPLVHPAPGIQPGATPSDPTNGLKTSRPLATSTAGADGTTHVGAVLQLFAPTSTKAGTYDATLTLTAI